MINRGYVYLAARDGLTKIGRGKNPAQRARSLGNDAKLIHQIVTDNNVWLEAPLHATFCSRHEEGEWFKLTPADVEELKAIHRWDMADDIRLSMQVKLKIRATDLEAGLVIAPASWWRAVRAESQMARVSVSEYMQAALAEAQARRVPPPPPA